MYALLYTLSTHRLVIFPISQLIIEGLLGALLFFALFSLLWRVMRYGNFQSFDIYQRFINYTALGILIVFIWSTINHGISLIIFGSEDMVEITKIIPIKAFIAFLIYLVVVQYFKTKLSQPSSNNEIELNLEDVLDEPYEVEEDDIQFLERIVVKTGQKNRCYLC